MRLSTYVGDKAKLPEADARLQAFMRAADPQLAFRLPGATAVTHVASAAEVAALEVHYKPPELVD